MSVMRAMDIDGSLTAIPSSASSQRLEKEPKPVAFDALDKDEGSTLIGCFSFRAPANAEPWRSV
jgi:hypothetical protein